MTLHDLYAAAGAQIAPDGIPLRFADPAEEDHAAREAAVLMDRSHEARVLLRGAGRLALLHRMSTHDVAHLPVDMGRPTIFTNPNARILDRVEVFNRDDDTLLLGEPGRGAPLTQYLMRNIFFGDEVQVMDLGAATVQFDVHGPAAEALAADLLGEDLPLLAGRSLTLADATVYMARRKPVIDSRLSLIIPKASAGAVWETLLARGSAQGLRPAGSLAYHLLRVRAGLPSVGRELSADYIPLEVGLWDEVSFTKGCYTGQEIIARMESRGRLAKALARVTLAGAVDVPAPVYHEGKTAGTLTSSAVAPDGQAFGLAVVRPQLMRPGVTLHIGAVDGPLAAITGPAGVQPDYLDELQE